MSEVFPLLLSLAFLVITAVIGTYLYISKLLAGIRLKKEHDNSDNESRKKATQRLKSLFYGFAIITCTPILFYFFNILPAQKRVVQFDNPPPPRPIPTTSSPVPRPSESILEMIFSLYATPAPITADGQNNDKTATNSSDQLGIGILGLFGILVLLSFKWFRPSISIKDRPINIVFYVVFALIFIYLIGLIIGMVYVATGYYLIFRAR